MKTQTLCLVKNLKKNIRCDRCDILLDLRIKRKNLNQIKN